MNNEQIIGIYESILALTGQMLEAARASDWDRLVDLENECRGLIETLQASSPDGPLSADHRQRKIEIIRKVLADDAEIRSLTQDWTEKLRHILGSAGSERKIQQAYWSDFGG